jgi:predicted RNA-binding protein associated with RNAse of E/G family
MNEITVIKRRANGQEAWRYTGVVVEQGADWVKLEAYFNLDDLPFHGMVLGRGDRFIETFYANRWYNIFEMHDRESDQLKGWYCNVTRPAVIGDGRVSYEDLALDLLVFPDRRQLVLDEDEFAELNLAEDESLQARTALVELQAIFARPD